MVSGLIKGIAGQVELDSGLQVPFISQSFCEWHRALPFYGTCAAMW